VRTRRRGVEGAGGEGGDGGGGGRHGKRGHGANTRAEEPAASGSDKRAHVCGAADSCGLLRKSESEKGRRRRPRVEPQKKQRCKMISTMWKLNRYFHSFLSA
jgi:hypothetical protein